MRLCKDGKVLAQKMSSHDHLKSLTRRIELFLSNHHTISIATSTAGWTIADDTSTTQIVGGGDTLTVLGTANQIQTLVSPQDTITFSFPNNLIKLSYLSN